MSILSGKHFVVLVADMHDEREFWYPTIRLQEAGAEVTVAGPESGREYKGKSGLPAKSDKAFAELDASVVDGVVIPGGFAPDYMRRSPECIHFVKEVHAQNKLVAFICHAGWVAISAGILKGKRATSFPSIKDDMVNAGCHWVDGGLVRDDNLISSRNPGDLPLFMKGILEYFEEKQ